MDISSYLTKSYDTVKDRTALVTGASSGIGLATACQLAEAGVHLKLVARREQRLQDIRAALNQRFPDISVDYLVADLACPEAWDTLASAGFYDVDILMNNAGLAIGREPIASSEFKDWKAMLDLNIISAFEITRRVVPGMLERGRGDIVLMGSVAGQIAYEGGAIYCASKHALRAFAQSLRRETCGNNLRVVLISPGMVKTEFSRVRFDSETEAENIYKGMTPLSGADIARNILFALQQPRHINWDELLIMATAQGGVSKVVRQLE